MRSKNVKNLASSMASESLLTTSTETFVNSRQIYNNNTNNDINASKSLIDKIVDSESVASSNISRSDPRRLNLKSPLIISSFLILLITLVTVMALVDLYVINKRSNNSFSSRIILTKAKKINYYDNNESENETLYRRIDRKANLQNNINYDSTNDTIKNNTIIIDENLYYNLNSTNTTNITFSILNEYNDYNLSTINNHSITKLKNTSAINTVTKIDTINITTTIAATTDTPISTYINNNHSTNNTTYGKTDNTKIITINTSTSTTSIKTTTYGIIGIADIKTTTNTTYTGINKTTYVIGTTDNPKISSSFTPSNAIIDITDTTETITTTSSITSSTITSSTITSSITAAKASPNTSSTITSSTITSSITAAKTSPNTTSTITSSTITSSITAAKTSPNTTSTIISTTTTSSTTAITSASTYTTARTNTITNAKSDALITKTDFGTTITATTASNDLLTKPKNSSEFGILLNHSKRSNITEAKIVPTPVSKKPPAYAWDHCGQTSINNSNILDNLRNDNNYRRLFKRIVGGQNAIKNSWPFLVSVRIKVNNRSIHNCGGALVSDQHVLTAAHCFIPYFKLLETQRLQLKDIFSLVEVQVGLLEHDQKNLTNDQIYQIEYFDIHDHFDFNEHTLYNDIAIIKLRRKVNLNRKEVNIICLPSHNNKYELEQGDTVAVVGWGAYAEEYDYGSYIKDILQQAVFQIKDQNDALCNSGLVGKKWNRNMSVCADGGGTNRRVTCFGDSGGPVMIYRNNRWILAGIVSFAHDTKDPNVNKKKCNASLPFYFVKLNAYIDWIDRKKNFMST